MSVFLKGLGLQNYRGVGSDWVYMHQFRSFNFFVGANNAGKSTVLNFISSRLPIVGHGRSRERDALSPLETHSGASGQTPRVAFNEQADKLVQDIHQSAQQSGIIDVANLRKVIHAVADSAGYVWSHAPVTFSQEFELQLNRSLESFQSLLGHPNEWHRLWSHLTGGSGGSIGAHWIPGVLDTIRKSISTALPKTRLIPAIRQIAAESADADEYSGAGLIERLARIQSPDFDRRMDREKFEQINRFLQTVTDRPDAQIEVPHARNHLLVHMDRKVLPLSSLGTGIHEVVMLAAFCTLSDKEILCIEEPELHLHPLLQRKLICYLQNNTTNQYFVATHSASFIDTPGSVVYHVRSDGVQTRITEAALAKERHAICTDLGHKASDIVQSNAIVWVEGPSDRIYLNHWIRALDPDLREGIHYSVMFYGGRLLSHLSADDEEVSEFIQLRALNRNLAIMIDSDRRSSHSLINATKLRIKREFEEGGSMAWITKGREVENYIEHAELQSAVKAVVGVAYGSALEGGPYDHALHFQRAELKRTRTKPAPANLRESEVDKVKVAKQVVQGAASLGVLDLRPKIESLVAMVRAANA